MNLDLDRLISSEKNYEKLIKLTLKDIEKHSDQYTTLRNIVLYSKQVLASATPRKRYFCLLLVKDIFSAFTSEQFQKWIDQFMADRVLNIVKGHLEGKIRSSRTGNQDKEYSEKLFHFAVQTITFWAKRLNVLPKSNFGQAYEEIKKLKIEIPSEFKFYRKEDLLQLWKGDKSEILNPQMSPSLSELNEKFKECKASIQSTINEAVINDEEVLMRPIIKTVREFLVLFFSKYKGLEQQENMDRSVVIVYFHIMNEFYKRICNRLYISVQQLISITKETFEGTYSSDYDSVERRDMIALAGVFKYNALTIFQRIHQKIQKQDKMLGECKVSLNLDFQEKLQESEVKFSKKEKHR